MVWKNVENIGTIWQSGLNWNKKRKLQKRPLNLQCRSSYYFLFLGNWLLFEKERGEDKIIPLGTKFIREVNFYFICFCSLYTLSLAKMVDWKVCVVQFSFLGKSESSQKFNASTKFGIKSQHVSKLVISQFKRGKIDFESLSIKFCLLFSFRIFCHFQVGTLLHGNLAFSS